MLINITKINLNPNSGGSVKPVELETKEVTITENGNTTVTPSTGYDGMGKVTVTTDVPTPKIETNKSISITENGEYTVTPSTGYNGIDGVDINVFVSEIGTTIDFSEIGYTETDNANANMIIQDGINYAKQVQAEYTDSKSYAEDENLVYFPTVDTSNRTTCSSMFKSCGSLQYVPPLTISNKCTSLNSMLMSCGALKSIDVSRWDTSNVTNMGYLFYECSTLKEITGIQNWDVSNVNNMSNIFGYCLALENIDLSGWDITSATNISNMNQIFLNCNSLINLNISGWDFSNFTTMPGNFLNGVSELQTINITNCNFSTFTSFASFLSGKSKLTEIIGINTINTSSATSMYRMFYSCYSLSSLDVSNFNTSNVTNMSAMFSSCRNITALDLSSWDVSNVTDAGDIFYGCTSLTNFQAPQNINVNIGFSSCNNLTVDSLLSILNNLTDRISTTTLTCTLGSVNLAKLTDEQKAIATNKNWVLN